MFYFIGQHLIELQSATQTIRNDIFGVQRFYFFHQALAQLHRGLMEFAFEPHNARHTAAVQLAFDRLKFDSGDVLQKIKIRSADVLLPQVAGGEVNHAARKLACCCL